MTTALQTTYRNLDQGRRRERPAKSDSGMRESLVVRDLFGAVDSSGSGPQGFLVERYPPESRSGAHFHPVDQFQLFFPAPGAWYQRQQVTDVLVHYSDAFSTYGPFGSGPAPFTFLTLRAKATTETHFMPGAREHLEPSPARRNIHARLDMAALGEDRERASATPVIGPEQDGLAAHVIVAPPGPVTLPSLPPTSAGEYHCVLRGELRHGRHRLAEGALGWRPPGTLPPDLSTETHAVLLVVQFPAPRPVRRAEAPT